MKTPKLLIDNLKDYIFIIFGLILYAVGFTAFILPHRIIIGGMAASHIYTSTSPRD
ncbi:MAG: YitT family protein, partial [Muribaculaceae bacterium]|nr:YitT family protein [Muribaculaceae bacterium]